VMSGMQDGDADHLEKYYSRYLTERFIYVSNEILTLKISITS
jgi:hypothetical protein